MKNAKENADFSALVFRAVKSALSIHPHAWIETCRFCEETETYDVDVSGIEEGDEFSALEAVENALKAAGFRIVAGEQNERRVGCFWVILETA